MPPPHPTSKAKAQKERPPRADGRSPAASLQHPSVNEENNRLEDASASAAQLPHRPRENGRRSQNERPSPVAVHRRRPCDGCRRRSIKCRHAKTQPQSLCETRKPSSGPATDSTSDAAGSEVPALQEASDVAGDTSSSSEDGDRLNLHTPIRRYTEDLSRDGNPLPLASGSLSDGNNVRQTTKDGTVDVWTQLTLTLLDEYLLNDNRCLSPKDAELNSFLPPAGNQSLSVYAIPDSYTQTWRPEDDRVGVTMPLRRRRSRQGSTRGSRRVGRRGGGGRTSTEASSSSRNNGGRQPRRATASIAQETDDQDEQISLSVTSDPPSARAESQALDLETYYSSQGLHDGPSQPETLPPQMLLYNPAQGFNNIDDTFPAAANDANMLPLADGEDLHQFYNPNIVYPQQHYTPHLIVAALPNGHYHQASSATMYYGGQTRSAYHSEQQQQYLNNFQHFADNMMGRPLGEVQHQMALNAPTNHLVPAQMIPSLPQQYSPDLLQNARNTEMNFGGERQYQVAFVAPTDNYEQVQFGQTPGEMSMIHDTAAAATATTAQFPQLDYGDMYLGSNSNNFPLESADAAYTPDAPYDHTMTAQRPTSDTSANIPSLIYDSRSTPTDPSGGGQYARSTLSGSSPPGEALPLGIGEMGDASSNGYQMPPAESTSMSMTASTDDAISGLKKAPFTDPVFPYGTDMESEELME